jgi:hypothetical protein
MDNRLVEGWEVLDRPPNDPDTFAKRDPSPAPFPSRLVPETHEQPTLKAETRKIMSAETKGKSTHDPMGQAVKAEHHRNVNKEAIS